MITQLFIDWIRPIHAKHKRGLSMVKSVCRYPKRTIIMRGGRSISREPCMMDIVLSIDPRRIFFFVDKETECARPLEARPFIAEKKKHSNENLRKLMEYQV